MNSYRLTLPGLAFQRALRRVAIVVEAAGPGTHPGLRRIEATVSNGHLFLTATDRYIMFTESVPLKEPQSRAEGQVFYLPPLAAKETTRFQWAREKTDAVLTWTQPYRVVIDSIDSPGPITYITDSTTTTPNLLDLFTNYLRKETITTGSIAIGATLAHGVNKAAKIGRANSLALHVRAVPAPYSSRPAAMIQFSGNSCSFQAVGTALVDGEEPTTPPPTYRYSTAMVREHEGHPLANPRNHLPHPLLPGPHVHHHLDPLQVRNTP